MYIGNCYIEEEKGKYFAKGYWGKTEVYPEYIATELYQRKEFFKANKKGFEKVKFILKWKYNIEI